MNPSARRRPTVAAALAWSVVAGIVAVGEFVDEPERDAGETTASVTFIDLSGHPVAAPPAPLPAPSVRPPSAPTPRAPTTPDRTRRTLPRPFAAVRAFASPLIMPRLTLPRALTPHLSVIEGLAARARPGEPVAVRLSAYCLRGLTRRGREVRPGIVAADPSIFPLARHVEISVDGRYLGTFLVDDTGKKIRGTRIDIWTPDCTDARRFGMRDGVAVLVAAGGP